MIYTYAFSIGTGYIKAAYCNGSFVHFSLCFNRVSVRLK